MSQDQEVDWGLVARKIISTLGAESARGLLYGIMASAVAPAIIGKIRELASGRREDEVMRELRDLLARQQSISAQQLAPQDIERMLAQALRQYGQTPPYPWPQPPPHPPPWVQERIESLKREIRNWEDIRDELRKKKYLEPDQEKAKQVDEKLREVEEKITSLRNDLLRLTTQAQWE
ncbi:MAG: hypothetical protein ABWK01_03270 [Infirmifilum sp.]